jgi:hypothetical protein
MTFNKLATDGESKKSEEEEASVSSERESRNEEILSLCRAKLREKSIWVKQANHLKASNYPEAFQMFWGM